MIAGRTLVQLPKLASVLEQVEPDNELHVQFDRLSYVDHACLDLLMNWEKQHLATGSKLVIIGVRSKPKVGGAIGRAPWQLRRPHRPEVFSLLHLASKNA